MDEQAALVVLARELPAAGDDAAVVDGLVVTTDMLHESTDFPAGTTRYTAGWRAVGASLSDVAAMGADAVAVVSAYGAPAFDRDELVKFVEGARDVCSRVGAEYVGGDLDTHPEFTVATTAVGRTRSPVYRSGASAGEVVCVTGSLGRSAAAVRLFEAGESEMANELFRFTPRVAAGKTIAGVATAMIDSSDGLARSLHQLAAASGCGFELVRDAVPVDEAVGRVASTAEEVFDLGVFFGEDFELVFTAPGGAIDELERDVDAGVTVIGNVTEQGVLLDGKELPDRGYSHGANS